MRSLLERLEGGLSGQFACFGSHSRFGRGVGGVRGPCFVCFGISIPDLRGILPDLGGIMALL